MLLGFDLPLLLMVLALAALGMVTMYSVGYDHGTRFQDHGRNMVLAALLMFAVAQIPPQRLMALAVAWGEAPVRKIQPASERIRRTAPPVRNSLVTARARSNP